jgi:tyrosyl-tRNA synthetase
MDKKEQIHNLIHRNVTDVITISELEKKLTSGDKLKVYLGVDPSGADIHLGHAVVLWKLRQFQELGHEVILLIGDFTAQIGDPTGKSKERVPLSHEAVLENAKHYKEQAAKILKFDGDNSARMMFNSSWLSKLSLKELIQFASHLTVQQLIERDMFQERLKTGQPIGLHEFIYPLLVGYDCIELSVDVEVGGNDQLFNIKMGRTLMEKVKNKKKVVLVCDLLTGSDGSKMSKSAGNIIALNSGADDMFGKLMAIDDELISEYARLCTDMDEKELLSVAKRLKSNENPRNIKLDLASRVVERYYANMGELSKERWLNAFSKGSASVITVSHNKKTITLPEIVQILNNVIKLSNSELRRLVEGGAVEVDEKLVEVSGMLKVYNIESAGLKVRIGKKCLATIYYKNE